MPEGMPTNGPHTIRTLVPWVASLWVAPGVSSFLQKDSGDSLNVSQRVAGQLNDMLALDWLRVPAAHLPRCSSFGWFGILILLHQKRPSPLRVPRFPEYKIHDGPARSYFWGNAVHVEKWSWISFSRFYDLGGFSHRGHSPIYPRQPAGVQKQQANPQFTSDWLIS